MIHFRTFFSQTWSRYRDLCIPAIVMLIVIACVFIAIVKVFGETLECKCGIPYGEPHGTVSGEAF